MHRKHHRVPPILLAAVAALSLSAAPALAGSDGCVGGDCQDQNTPAPTLPQTAVPVAPAPAAPTPAPTSESGGTLPEQASQAPRKSTSSPSKSKIKAKTKARTVATRTVALRTVTQGTVPSGGVAAGAGGTAPQNPDGSLLGLVGGGLLVLIGGGMVATSRRRA